MKLSIIDQSPVSSGSTPADALNNTIELARLADRLGYTRYWIAEHHAMDTLASPAPEVLIARIGAETHGIRVGSGGVMLPHYSAMKVAEVFRMLHALYPGRIDLGIGRAPGGSPLETYALMRDRRLERTGDDFGQQLLELLAFLHQRFPAEHPFKQIKLSPDMPGVPEVWMLGSSMWSASAAAQLGLPYAFAHFIDQHPTRAALEHYREHFKPGEIEAPASIVALGAICAETEAEAQRLAMSSRLLIKRIRTGDRRTVPTPEEAIAELGENRDLPQPERKNEFPRYFVGEPERVRDNLIDMASQLHLDEVMIVTIVHDHRARMRSYELLAQAFNLTPREIP